MPTKKQERRYHTIEIVCRLPLSEQLHEANDLLCLEAAIDEKVSLEKIKTRKGHILLFYRLWRDKKVM